MRTNLLYALLIIGIAIAGFFLLRALMIIGKAFVRIIRNYRKLGHEEFMRRLKDGAERITPLQKTKVELKGIIITTIGILAGLIATPIVRINGVWFWVELILIGSLIISLFQLLGKWQLYRIQKKQDEIMNQLNLEEDNGKL